MADYKVTDTELTSIANAIRAKTGKSDQIEFPMEFVYEIGSIRGGGISLIQDVSVISASNIVTEFETVPNIQFPDDVIVNVNVNFMDSSLYGYIHADLDAQDTSATIYGVCKCISGSQPIGVAIGASYSSGNTPEIYAENRQWYTTVYGYDASSRKPANVFTALAMSVNNGTAKYFISDDFQRTLQYTHSGRYGSWGGGTNNNGENYQTGNVYVAYGALVKGIETDEEILANINRIMTKYSDIIGT